MDASSHFRGKKITLMGLGLLDRGVGDARYLAEQGAELIVTDLKSAEALAPSVEALAGLPITFVLGEHRLEDFQGRDLVLAAPKTPLDSAYVDEAKRNGIPVSMTTALFAKYAKEAGATIVGITGTRGKTTTTEMIARILKTAGKKVLVGGNVRGVSTLALLPEVGADTVAVLELDSWQLQGFGMEKMSPDVAVFTNLMPDHQDYYPDMDTYFADKAEIYRHQGAERVLITTESLKERVGDAKGAVRIAKAYDGALIVPGEHNRMNAGCAREAALALHIGEEAIASALASFAGVPGRLELVREIDGVQFYNDTNATTPDATIAALRALDPEAKKNIILIMGGSDKGLDMSALWKEVLERAKDLYFLKGSGIDRIRPEAPQVPIHDTLASVVEAARAGAAPGDIILFSPAFASFGMFKNEYDRGDQFDALVRSL